MPYDITYMWNLKCNTKEPVYNIETDSQTQRADLRLPRGRDLGDGRSGESGLADVSGYVQERETAKS